MRQYHEPVHPLVEETLILSRSPCSPRLPCSSSPPASLLGGEVNDSGEGVALGFELWDDLSPNCVVADDDDPLAVLKVQVERQSIDSKYGNT